MKNTAVGAGSPRPRARAGKPCPYLLGVSLLVLGLLPQLARADGILIPPEGQPNFAVKYHHVDVNINGQVCTTKIDQVFLNRSGRQQEATYIFPLPEGAAVKDFTIWDGDRRLEPKLMERDEARRIYEDIVRRRKDPGLLEYMGRNLYQASLFPIPANGEKRTEMEYSEVLKTTGNMIGYLYPLSTEKFSSEPIQEVTINIKLHSDQPLTTVYSPTHDIQVERKGANDVVAHLELKNSKPNQDFLLYYGVAKDSLGTYLITHKPRGEDGFFLFVATPPAEVKAPPLPKDVIFVIDTSGSMSGEKIEQAKGALKFCINSLNPNDRFGVVRFSSAVEDATKGFIAANSENKRKANALAESLTASGGTDINSALKTAFGYNFSDRPTYIVFLTDGLPTVGETNVDAILRNVRQWNHTGPVALMENIEDATRRPVTGEIEVQGKLTDEGVECQALRGDDGKVYTLTGDLKGFRNGDEVRVIGKIAEVSYCMQGTTISVSWIGRKGEKGEKGEETRPIKGARLARIFSFGVGYDVNTHFLDQMVEDSAGVSEYVRPQESIEQKVSTFFAKVSRPLVTNLKLNLGDVQTYDVFPKELPDLYAGSQLLVFGRYRADHDLVANVSLTGRSSVPNLAVTTAESLPANRSGRGAPAFGIFALATLMLLSFGTGRKLGLKGWKLFLLPLTVGILAFAIAGDKTLGTASAARIGDDGATQISLRASFPEWEPGNAPLAPLWATRKIGYLVDEIRLKGQNKELVDEVVNLSLKYGILTEYTAFLADERTAPIALEETRRFADANLGAGLPQTSGGWALSQSRNVAKQKLATSPSAMTRYETAEGKEVVIQGVQNVNNQAFFYRQGNWVDGRYEPDKQQIIQVQSFSDAYFQIVNQVPRLVPYLANGANVIIYANDGYALQVGENFTKTTLTDSELQALLAE